MSRDFSHPVSFDEITAGLEPDHFGDLGTPEDVETFTALLWERWPVRDRHATIDGRHAQDLSEVVFSAWCAGERAS